VLLLMTGGLLCGCTSYAGISGEPSTAPASSFSGYGSDQLEQALLTSVSGYQQTGAAQSGNYSELPDVQSFLSMRQGVKLSKPQCQSTTVTGVVGQDRQLPAAVVSFAHGSGGTVTETLLSMNPKDAAQQVALRLPADCRSFKVHIDRQWATETVTQSTADVVGEGSRTVGVSTTVGGQTVDSWFVTFYSRTYLATVSVYGSGATRGRATSIARAAYAEAERVLP
jgi:hypothetical protein